MVIDIPDIRSDDLKSFLPGGSMRGWTQFTGVSPRRFLVVADLNALIDEVTFTGRRQVRSALAECQDAGLLVIVAPTSAFDDVAQRLNRVAKGDEERLQKTWYEIAEKRVWFFDLDPDVQLPDWAHELRDPEDAKFAKLWEQLHADFILSRDSHLACLHGAPVCSGLKLSAARDHARVLAPALHMNVANSLISICGFKVTTELLRAALNNVVPAGIIAGFVYLLLRPHLTNLNLMEPLLALLSSAGQKFAEPYRMQQEAQFLISELTRKVDLWRPSLTHADRMFRHLLVSRKAMRPKELSLAGWGQPPHPTSVAAMLRADTRFMRRGDGLWIPARSHARIC